MSKGLLNFGYSDALPAHLKNRVVPTNLVAILLIVLVAIPFVVISLLFFPQITALIPFLGGLTCVLVILANFFGGIRYSRLVMAVLPLLLAASYNAVLCGEGDEPIMSVYLTELSFALIPFVIFDIKEKVFLTITSTISALTIISFPYTKLWLTLEAETGILRHGWLGNVTVCLGILTAFGCVLGLVAIGKKAEKESDEMRKVAEEEKGKLEIEKEENIKKTEELSKKQAEEKKRQWANEGITLVSKVIREDREDGKLYEKIVSTVVKYIHANQGGLFLVDGENDRTEITLKACYAYGKKKHAEKTILPGQGIVGQAYMERQHVYLTDIPQNYVNITSGLGEATPTALLVIPLMVNEVVQGLFEIASFQKIDAFEIDFLEKLGEIIAAHINNQRVVEQTQRLLQQSQEQSEEMRAQEEEMRQNMEELAATQEHAQRQINENKRVYDQVQTREMVVGHTTILSEADPYGTIIFVNDKLCEISKYSREELIGKAHNIFRHPDMPSALFKSFWETIQQGKIFKGIIKNKAKDGSHYWVDATIMPVKDENEKIIKYIGARYHITDDFVAEHLYNKQLKSLGIREESTVG